MPRPLQIVASSVLVLGLGSITLAQHGPAKVAAQDNVPARKLVPAKDPADQTREAERMKLLRIGDKAPMPHLAEILKGNTDFVAFPEGKVTVMEFWATWCGPCRVGMPHISELQKRHADQGLTIIGVSREKPEVVKQFLAKPEWEQKTQYTMALDDDSKTNNAYMKAARQTGIPCAFVVDQEGRVAWIGHPMRMDEPLAKIIDGKWDVAKARAEFDEAERAKQMMRQVNLSMREGQRSGDYTETLKTLDRAMTQLPDNSDLQMMKFRLMVGPVDDPTGYELGWKLLKANRSDSMMLNRIAWYVLDDPAVENRDLGFAMSVAKAANEAAGGNNAAVLDTLARAYFEKGDLGSAVKYQKKAVDKADGQMKEQMTEVLEQYRKASTKQPA